MKRVPPAVLTLFLSTAAAEAQVLITEVQPESAAEWIELHNTGGAAVDIGGWQVHDWAGAMPGRLYSFPAGTMLQPNQVVIIAVSAPAYTTHAMTQAYPVTTADFELAVGGDDPTVPNLIAAASGNNWALNNNGDAIQLLDAASAQVDAVEWGNVDRVEIPGTSAPDTAANESLCRVNDTNDSSVDFAVCQPTPGTGYAGPTPTPPVITNAVRAPAILSPGATFSVSATITDADGLMNASVYFATATSASGSSEGAYVAAPAAAVGMNGYRASGVIESLVGFPAPTGFAERYVRYFIAATDTLSNAATLPAGAVTTAENGAYYWENVLPASTVFSIAEARAQDANEIPIYDGHSIRVEGVALTNREAFIGGSTNFFIAAPSGVDAIRIFDDVLIATPIAPGDVVRVTGKIGVYRGVRQIGRDERANQPAVVGPEIEVVVTGNAPVPMITTDIATLLANGETNESQLVEIPGVMLVPNPSNGEAVPPTWIGNGTLYVSDGTGTLAVRVASFVDLADTPTPSGTFDLRGIFTQFAPSGTGGYQLQPRSLEDVIGGGPPVDGGMIDGGGEDGGFDDLGGTDAMTPIDGGVDAGSDSGADTGSSADAGATDAAKDAGFFGTDRDRGGCGCSAAEERPIGFTGLPLLAIGLLWARCLGRGRTSRLAPTKDKRAARD